MPEPLTAGTLISHYRIVRRLGAGGDQILIMSDIDSIDATQIKTDFLAHSYFGDSDTLL